MLNILGLISPSVIQQQENVEKSLLVDTATDGSKQDKQNKSLLKVQKQMKNYSLFKNSSMLKQDLLVSKLYQLITGAQKKFMPQIKLQPTLFINKIQESRPHFKSKMVYKQLGYDIHLQSQGMKTDIIKNCISPARSNSQIYKRLSTSFFENLKNGVDQCMLFTGIQSKARVQSSIGNQQNPGIFMIVAIAILDQKYKQNHERFDVEFSFLQFKGQRMYDLINYTQMPLWAKQKQTKNSQGHSNLQFCQHRVKVCTFLQFIKLFKIALFNNKQRDLRTNRNYQEEKGHTDKAGSSQLFSTFIMKIRVKKYNVEGDLTHEQETLLIDFDQNCSGRNSNKQQQVPRSQGYPTEVKQKSQQSSSRSLMDYILIEMNNSSIHNKAIHYHMVEKNLILQIMKKYLRRTKKSSQGIPSFISQNVHNQNNKSTKKSNPNIAPLLCTKQDNNQQQIGGQLFIINSLTTNSKHYARNIKLYESLIISIGNQWTANYRHKPKFNHFFDLNFADKVLQKVVYCIKNKKYTSLRDLYTVKQFYSNECKRLSGSIKSYKNLILQYLNMKKQLKYSQNVFTAYELQLIGNCIKSDNLKDFYTSKSFLSLPRKIQIKTEKIKEEIINYIQGLKTIESKFSLLKKKQNEERKSSIEPPGFMANSVGPLENLKQEKRHQLKPNDVGSSNKKFKLLEKQDSRPIFEEFNDFQEFTSLRKYIYDYFSEVWSKAYLTQERTITEEIMFADHFSQQITSLKQLFCVFGKQVNLIQESNIKCLSDNKLLSLGNFTQLIRSINQANNSILKHEPKHSGKSPFSIRKNGSTKLHDDQCIKQSILHTASYLPKIQQVQNTLLAKKQKSLSTKAAKQNFQGKMSKKFDKRAEIFQIKGKVDFSSLIVNPREI